jgi:leader peptidase (prepilin peptidase)/N-methyltransferase
LEYNENVSKLVLPILLGGILGVLVNYLADVLPATRRFSQAVCPGCGAPFSAGDFFMGRDCPHCGHKRTFRFWSVILVMAALSTYLFLSPPRDYRQIAFSVNLAYLLGALLGLGIGWMSHGLASTLWGGLAGFGIMLFIYGLGWIFTQLRARRIQSAGGTPDDEEALGQGDVILATVLGLLLGWPLIWFGLLLGIVLAGIFGILLVLWMLVARRYSRQAWMVFMPYGPFFILSASLIIFFPHWLSLVVPK